MPGSGPNLFQLVGLEFVQASAFRTGKHYRTSEIQPLAGAFDNRPQWDEPPRARTLHRPVALGNLGIEIGHGYHSITARALTRPILTRFLLQAMDSYLVVNGILDYSAMYQFYFKQYTGSS